jgi:hypothetical protein
MKEFFLNLNHEQNSTKLGAPIARKNDRLKPHMQCWEQIIRPLRRHYRPKIANQTMQILFFKHLNFIHNCTGDVAYVRHKNSKYELSSFEASVQ